MLCPMTTLYRSVNPDYYAFELGGKAQPCDDAQPSVPPVPPVPPQPLESGDYVPFVALTRLNSTTKELHNYVDARAFLFVGPLGLPTLRELAHLVWLTVRCCWLLGLGKPMCA